MTWRFRLTHGDEWFEVVVSPSRRAMLREMSKWADGDTFPDGLSGAVLGCGIRGMPGIVGVIFLDQRELGAGYVAHELTHAAFRLMDKRGIRVDHWEHPGDQIGADTPEETFAMVVEALTRDFWATIYDNGYAKAG